ncbi:modification methylase DpnIIB-like protein [Ligilactobacillus pobuzihii E100301 = KCTC 13174]|uniref:Methyltransferase n=1 Tax=Ligilactobacillus pobuzihii TaxID=449659 RepID=A0A0R2LD00_9LACO|nr:modification methylase DpnIIB-like protein [Ligilactobacillus pobuzihii E100301 = KCTC 13174]KRN99488.1 modification methylase DpnIIB-like protein [Ligilactobacillus pobuzihii]
MANKAYASNPAWYNGGDDKNGESKKANSTFFDTDVDFRIAEYMHFCSRMLVKEPKKGRNKAPAMVVFCAFEQLQMVIDYGKRYGFQHYIPLTFIKKSSAQALKANMKIVGGCEYGLVLYRDKLPKFNNDGQMIMNWFHWDIDNSYPKIHPTQKPVPVLKRLIEIFSDPGDTVIDPVAGSGSTLRAAAELNRSAYGFEIKKDMFRLANEKMLNHAEMSLLAL